MGKEMLINTVAGVECRIAIVQDGRLEELYIERASSASHVSNIYKGKITNVEPSIQAAFVDFGLSKNGFLHISDVHPQFFPKGQNHDSEQVGRKRSRRLRPPIQECLRRGSEVVVQMTKEGIGTKGPTMTTYLSIPGRLLVMMPGMSRLGVTRKIEDPEIRDKARKILGELDLPPDMGFILRTAGIERPKRELQRDLKYLMRLWGTVKQRIEKSKVPAEIYQESDLVIRTIRDVYDADVSRVVCDDESVAKKAREFLAVAMPRTKHKIEVYTGKEGLFHDFGLEQEIEKIYHRHVAMPSGGSLVIDQTEALVAIDVNSGKFREHSDAETTALKINVEAAKEIARQLRLRDMGGVIVMDFIDMRDQKNRRELEKTLRNVMKDDRAKTKLLRISSFGIVEMTRQRIRPSLKDSIYRRCVFCEGSGLIKSEESQSLLVMRALQRATSNDNVAHVNVKVTPLVAHHLTNCQRKEIVQLESDTGKTVIIQADPDLAGDEMKVVCTNSRGSEVSWEHEPLTKPGKTAPQTVSVEDLLKGKSKPSDETPPKANGEGPTPEKESESPPNGKKPRRRGRRGGRKHKKHSEESDEPSKKPEQDTSPAKGSDTPDESAEKSSRDGVVKKKTRRGGRKHKKHSEKSAEPSKEPEQKDSPSKGSDKPGESTEKPTEEGAVKKKKTRRGGRRRKSAKRAEKKPE